MARPRAFDETSAIRSAGELFARHGYEGTSIDDLVRHLGMHRGSIYRAFGSKHELFLLALRRELDDRVLPWLAAMTPAGPAVVGTVVSSTIGLALELLLVAAVEQAPVDQLVAAQVDRAFRAMESALLPTTPEAVDLSVALSATVLGLLVRIRAGLSSERAADAAASLTRAVI